MTVRRLPQLDRLISERDQAEQTITQILEAVGEDRDVSDAEMTQVQAVRERIEKLDSQIKPLQDLQDRMEAHAETVRSIAPAAVPQRSNESDEGRLTVRQRKVEYSSPGAFMVDLVRSFEHAPQQLAHMYDRDAAQRVAAALGRAAGDVAAGFHQTTDDTPGLMPKNIIGEIMSDLDGTRPLIDAIGAKDLAGIPGKVFSRPVVTKHPKEAGSKGKQTAEKAEGDSSELKINGVDFTKSTFLRWMNVSRQEIDWTSPAVWDTLIAEMIAVYGEDTEDDAGATLASIVPSDQSVAVAGDTVEDWIKAFYAAKSLVTTANKKKRASVRRLPNTIFVSYDMDDVLGVLIDVHLATQRNPVGTSQLDTFGGQLMRLPRVMSPGLPEKTIILGRKEGFEFYEQRVGLLQAVEPKVFGVEISYGGYAASGAVDATLFAKITKA